MIRQHPAHPHRAGRASRTSDSDSLPYRVQLHDRESDRWRPYANFRFAGEAEACLQELRQRGIDARMHVDSRHVVA